MISPIARLPPSTASFPALEMFRHQSHLAVDIGRQRFAGVLRVAGDIERRCIRTGRHEHDPDSFQEG